jgi:hypothetical protein
MRTPDCGGVVSVCRWTCVLEGRAACILEWCISWGVSASQWVGGRAGEQGTLRNPRADQVKTSIWGDRMGTDRLPMREGRSLDPRAQTSPETPSASVSVDEGKEPGNKSPVTSYLTSAYGSTSTTQWFHCESKMTSRTWCREWCVGKKIKNATIMSLFTL